MKKAFLVLALTLALASSRAVYAQEATPQAQKGCSNGLVNTHCEDRPKALGLTAAVVAVGTVALGVGAVAAVKRPK